MGGTMSAMEMLAGARGVALWVPAPGLSLTGLLAKQLARYEFELDALRAGGQAIEIDVAFLDDLAFDACAARIDDVDLVAMNRGVFFRLLGAFRALIAQPAAFPELGDPARRETLPGVSAHHFIAEDPDPAFYEGDGSGPEEALLIWELAVIADTFVFLHALTHLRYGHVDWAAQRFGMPAVGEQLFGTMPGLSGLDLQTIEFDADRGAIALTLARFLGASGGMAGVSFPDTSRLGSLELGIRKISFALYVCCKFFASPGDTTDVAQILQQLHPPAHLRMLAMIEQAVAVLHDQGGADLRAICEAIALGVSEAEASWSAAFGTQPIDVFADEHDAVSRQLLTLYAENLPRLRLRVSR